MTGNKILTIPNMSAGLSVIWGAWVLNPFTDMFPTNPHLYAGMSAWVPSEIFWGGLFFATGIGAWILSYYGRPERAAFILFLAYAFFSAMYFIGDYRLPGWGLYGYVSMCHFIYWRANTQCRA